MAILNALSGGVSIGGSRNQSVNSGYSTQAAISNSYSQTNAAAAREWSEEQAALAYARQKELMQAEMQFNRQEAQKSRDWETQMANTIYTRSVNNMIEAGINPVLAASMGLSGASVGSGATASIGGASAPLAQNFMDTSSASSSSSQGYGENHGESSGTSWNESENGLATGLQLLGNAISGAIEKISSGNKLDNAINSLTQYLKSGSTDPKEQGKHKNQSQNGNGNPFKKGTHGYEMYELEHAFKNAVK